MARIRLAHTTVLLWGVQFPFPAKFGLNPIVQVHKSHSPSGCLAQILISFRFSIVFCHDIRISVNEIPFSLRKIGNFQLSFTGILLLTSGLFECNYIQRRHGLETW